ncbi:ABC transporter substrate-binding protein [Roseovarius salis]|uniref:ABC transporter substrate-binding protein n=1 Tax=Roseovarius salis TaxID=3376063 RepID=UPI0037CB4735
MTAFVKNAGRAAVICAGMLGAGAATAQDDPLKIGLLLPFTGQYAWVGENVQPVAQMIAEEVNGSGGIGGREIAFVQGDTEGVVDAGTTAAQKLINVDNVMALVGPTSLSFSGSKNLIIDNGVPMVTPTAGTTELDRACKDVCFRTVPSDSLGGKAIARAATDAAYLGEGASAWENPVLMVAQSPAMVSFLEPIERSFAEYGVELAEVIEFTPGKPSYRSEVQEALAADPDGIVLVAAPEESARVMTNAFQSGYDGQWFVTQDQTNAEYIELAGADLVQGTYGLEEVASEEGQDLNRAFETRYEEYAGEEVKIFGTNTYDSMNVIALAMLSDQMDDGEITRATLARHIRAVSDPGEGKTQVTSYTEGKAALEAGESIDYRGLVGPIDFDEWGNIAAPFGIRQVQNGAWTTVAVVPASALD